MATRWDGRVIAHDSVSEGSTFAFNDTGRYVAAMQGFPGARPPLLWVVDVQRGRVVKRKHLPHNAGEALGWIDNDTVGMALLMDHPLTPILRVRGKQPKNDVPVYGKS